MLFSHFFTSVGVKLGNSCSDFQCRFSVPTNYLFLFGAVLFLHCLMTPGIVAVTIQVGGLEAPVSAASGSFQCLCWNLISRGRERLGRGGNLEHDGSLEPWSCILYFLRSWGAQGLRKWWAGGKGGRGGTIILERMAWDSHVSTLFAPQNHVTKAMAWASSSDPFCPHTSPSYRVYPTSRTLVFTLDRCCRNTTW